MVIYLKDSSKDMSEIDTASIDLIVTSPPYWNTKDYQHNNQLGKGLTYNHFIKILKNNMLECMRVLKEDGFSIFIVGDIRKEAKYSGERPKIFSLHSDVIHYFTEMGFDFFAHHIWKKTSVKKGAKRKIIYGAVYKNYGLPPFLYSDLSIEHILIFRKPGKRKTPNNKERASDVYTRIPKQELGQWLDPVWTIESPNNNSHPAPFPSELVCRLIRMHSLRYDTVLDPFCGIGTTLDVACTFERNAIGYEINEGYIAEITKIFDLKRSGNKLHSKIFSMS